jgi:transcriptional regulator of heat shock response
LHTLEDNEYAPSTLRKYLNALEKEGLVYQSYNSSGRIPTAGGLSKYIQDLIESDYDQTQYNIELQQSRMSLKYVVEQLGIIVDGVTVGFIERDEYFYLGINKLLKAELNPDEYETTREIIKIIEEKEII